MLNPLSAKKTAPLQPDDELRGIRQGWAHPSERVPVDFVESSLRFRHGFADDDGCVDHLAHLTGRKRLTGDPGIAGQSPPIDILERAPARRSALFAGSFACERRPNTWFPR